ncbi:general stress protein [Actinoplanes sp. HUAS TT8]|uniref:general stress protein n=1 Tax=Actinoplanes sp. HUAS TT8 TaxID=3447453 RepID=UPI003F5262AF
MTTPDNSDLTPAPATAPVTPAVTPPLDDPAAAAPSAGGSVPPGPAGVPQLPAQTLGAGARATGPTVVVGSYPEYALAQQAVDYLSDNKFPVERTSIIGTDLRLVENVLGRLTVGRAAGAGAASGAWFGLFIGVLFGLFSDSNWFAVILTTVLIGAVWGAVFGAIAHAATGGRRDFTSRSSLQAAQYAVLADADVADEAKTLLIRLNWQASGAQ